MFNIFRKKRRLADLVYQNMDREFFFDAERNEFVLDFNAQQKDVLLNAMVNKYSVQAIAYPDVSADCMMVCLDFMKPRQGYMAHNNVFPIDIWKTARIFKTDDECLMVLSAMEKKVNIFKEFKDVRALSHRTLELIYYAALENVNVCSLVRKGASDEEIEYYTRKRADRRAFLVGFRRWFVRFRNPENYR